jgi:hypothetical protein
MFTAEAPRHFLPGPGMPGAGLPHDRSARLAARRAFVALKQSFLDALAVLQVARPAELADAEWLRQQVRSAEEPVDLWLLRAPVFAALAGTDAERRRHRQALRRSLDQLFPDSEAGGPSSTFASLY